MPLRLTIEIYRDSLFIHLPYIGQGFFTLSGHPKISWDSWSTVQDEQRRVIDNSNKPMAWFEERADDAPQPDQSR